MGRADWRAVGATKAAWLLGVGGAGAVVGLAGASEEAFSTGGGEGWTFPSLESMRENSGIILDISVEIISSSLAVGVATTSDDISAGEIPSMVVSSSLVSRGVDISFPQDPPTHFEFGRNDLLRSGYD